MKAWIVALCVLATGIALGTSTASAMDDDQRIIKCPATWPLGEGARLVSAVVWPAGSVTPGWDIRTETKMVEAGTVTILDLEEYEQFLFCHYANGRRLTIAPPHETGECKTLLRTAPRHNELKTEGYCEDTIGDYLGPTLYRTYTARRLTRNTGFWGIKLGSKPDRVDQSGKYLDLAGTAHDLRDSWTSKRVIINDPDDPEVDFPTGTTLIYTYKVGTLVGLAIQPPRSEFHSARQYIELLEVLGKPDHGAWNDQIQSWDGSDGIKLSVRSHSMRNGKWVDDPELFVYDSRKMNDILQPKSH